MEKGGWRPTERLIKQQLAGGGFQEVLAAHDFGDAHLGVIDHHSELIRGDIIMTPNYEVAEVFTRQEVLRTAVAINERNAFTVGDAEAPVDASC